MANTKRKQRDAEDSSADTNTEAPAEPKMVLLDYDGIIARAPGQDEIRHTGSPVQIHWPEQGRKSLVIQPGLNIRPAAHWEFYASNSPQIAMMVKHEEIRVLDGLPTRESDLKDIISRTCDASALKALREAVEAGGDDLFDARYLVDRRDGLLRAIDARLGSTNRVEIPETPYVPKAIRSGPAKATGHGMGQMSA